LCAAVASFSVACVSEAEKKIPGGLLVAFEGTDGSGKSTQAKAAVAELAQQGFEAVYLKEPTDGPIGQKLRHMMVHNEHRDYMEEFRLFLEDREEDVRLNICPTLMRGGVVCIDRYYISSMAYQGALGLDPEFIRAENEKIAPRPDLVLYFRVPVEESLRRIVASRSEGQNQFELESYQRKVRDIFEALDLPGLVRVDAARGREQIAAEVLEIIQGAIAAKQR
jgi:dTMP kinase